MTARVYDSPVAVPSDCARLESGLALLPVLGAVTTLALLVTLLLTSALAAHATASYARDRSQSRALVRAILAQVEQAGRDGSLPQPSGTSAVQIVNGDLIAGAAPRSLDVARFPRPLVVAWPPESPGPAGAGSDEIGVGGRVELRAVLDPDGDARVVGDATLVDAVAEAWYGRGRAQGRARFLVGDGSIVRVE